MLGIKQLNMIVLSFMAAITLLNLGLAVNFFAASGQALAALFNGQSIYLLAGVELAAVLLAYVLHRQKTTARND